MGGDAKLRSKKELIEKFILENIPNIQDSDAIKDEFSAFWEKEQQAPVVTGNGPPLVPVPPSTIPPAYKCDLES